jgi:putative cardiolipin synthase
LVYDSPDKKHVLSGAAKGVLISTAVEKAIQAVKSDFVLVSPYLVPSDEELQTLKELRQREVRIRILTNSLESSPEVTAESGYEKYRAPLLQSGAELYEVRSLLGSNRGSGQSAKISRYGNYALHGKWYVFDHRRVLIGSMNFDQRSQHINTEVGLIIGSADLAQQTERRFDFMVKPENCYIVQLSPASIPGKPRLTWRTEENGTAVEYTHEPARNHWQRAESKLLALLPLEREL